MSRFSKTIKIKDSPYFKGWSKIERLNVKDIYDLFCLLKKYSYVVSDGSIKIEFLTEKEKEKNSSKFFETSDTVFVNVSSILEGKIDSTIGELMFSVLAKDSLKKSKLSTLLTQKLSNSTLKVLKRDGSEEGIYELRKFLKEKYLVDARNFFRGEFCGIPLESGSIRIIKNVEEIKGKKDFSVTSLIQNIKNAESVTKKLTKSVSALEHVLSCLFFFHSYSFLSKNVVKYCEAYLQESMISANSEFNEIFTEFALHYIFDDTVSDKFVLNFLKETKLWDLTTVSKDDLLVKTYLYFEPVLNNQIQNILNSFPASSILTFSSGQEFKEKIKGVSIVESPLLYGENNIMSVLSLGD